MFIFIATIEVHHVSKDVEFLFIYLFELEY